VDGGNVLERRAGPLARCAAPSARTGAPGAPTPSAGRWAGARWPWTALA